MATGRTQSGIARGLLEAGPSPEQRGLLLPFLIPRGGGQAELAVPEIIRGPAQSLQQLMDALAGGARPSDPGVPERAFDVASAATAGSSLPGIGGRLARGAAARADSALGIGVPGQLVARQAVREARRQAKTGAKEDFSISANKVSQSPKGVVPLEFRQRLFRYDILQNGKPVAEVRGAVNEAGDAARIDWIGPSVIEFAQSGRDRAMVVSVGVSGLKQLREAFRRDFPGVTTFVGGRISGARTGPAARRDADITQVVRLKTGDEAVFAAALGNADADDRIDVRMPDGTFVRNVPKNITQAGLARRIGLFQGAP